MKKHETDPIKLTIAGYKSIVEKQEIEIRPLTLLAGANSSGKSSTIQPLLLLKQTLEETYDPGALLLNGNNVKFTSIDQVLSKLDKKINAFSIAIDYSNDGLEFEFKKQIGKGFNISQMKIRENNEDVIFVPEMEHNDIIKLIPKKKLDKSPFSPSKNGKERLTIVRNRCFLMIDIKFFDYLLGFNEFMTTQFFSIISTIQKDIRGLIHLPGLRGNPERAYPVTAVGSTFTGTFESYTASVIAGWGEKEKEKDKLQELNEDLQLLQLTSTVTAKRLNDAQVELQVGMLTSKRRGHQSTVNIADVGFGMSQTLPVIVALHVANPGQIVYIEQPELHLHPRAQVRMAEVLAKAAKRGVRVIAETHSSLLLMSLQTLVAEGKLDPELVKLHWFMRENGKTNVTAANIDKAGRFGDWPVDFDDVSLETQSRYLDAAEKYLF